MPVQSVRLQNGDSFEESVFKETSRALRALREPYTVASPFYLEGKRQYDGLIIGPRAVFTLEMKNASGSVHMGPNTPLSIRDNLGHEIDAFKNRQEDARTQADMQWRKLSDYFKDNYGTDSIFVKAVLVFPNGTKFFVPPEHRDFSDYRVTVLFATVGELPKLVQTMEPPYPLVLDEKVQDILIRGIRDGVYSLSEGEKKLVTDVMPPRETASTDRSQPKRETPLRSSYDIAREKSARQSSARPYEAETPIVTPPPPEPPTLPRERPSWLWLPLWFIVVYFLLGFVTTATTALIGAAVFTFLLWLGRRTLATVSVVALFGGILLFNSINFVNLVRDGLEPLSTFTEAFDQELQPAEEVDAATGANRKEAGEEVEIEATAVPPTPRLRVVGNSNVRAEPNVESSVVGLAEADAVFVILDQTADRSWYKIRLSNGTEGWIGSTRVEQLSP